MSDRSDLPEISGVPELFVDGFICRCEGGIVHVLAYRRYGGRTEHVATWHMSMVGLVESLSTDWSREAGAEDIDVRVVN